MIVSDHQPYLFGHAGYWAKLLLVDVHVAMFDVRYKPDDHLGRCVLTSGLFSARLIADKEDDRISAVRLDQSRKLRSSIMQTLMTKQHPYRERLVPFVDSLADGMSYVVLWSRMLSCFVDAVGTDLALTRISQRRTTAETTFARNLQRLQWNVGCATGAEDTYLCGPHVVAYKGDEPCSMSIRVLRMVQPSPISMIEQLVSHERLSLPSYQTSDL